MVREPNRVTVRMFNVGFGDCFLLSFHYDKPLADQHILIDFGTVGGKADMKKIAKEIKEACEGKLYAVVATHRHRDHISGFSDKGGADSTGAIIASCKPMVVLQPWTENPDAPAKAETAPIFSKKKKADDRAMFFQSLLAMNTYTDTVVEQAKGWRGPGGRITTLEKLAFNNLTNQDAILNLRKMGTTRPRYLQYGSPSGLENSKLLPGVKVHVLGPPSLQEANLKKYAKNSDEYWISCAYWALQQRASSATRRLHLFPSEPRYGNSPKPFHTRWFVEHADSALKNNTLAIVSVLDSFLNNTSLILLFEVKGKKLLFPGDAQLENWSWALEQPEVRRLLADVDLYKVGHHGSRNATPKTLWGCFEKRKGGGKKGKAGAFYTMMSTASGVYQRTEEGKVPATRLVKQLGKESTLRNTQTLKGRPGPIVLEF